RLLRVLQEREVVRVGMTRPAKVDVRVVAATNTDLRELVAQGRFRDDLLYRLAVFPIFVPALRERPSDIPLLVFHALTQVRGPLATRVAREERSALSCSPLAMRLLRAYRWPGNVRELFAVIESAAIRAGFGRIEAQHLPAEVRGTTRATSVPPRYRHDASGDDERAAIVAALERTDGAIARAAELLGMGRTTLWRKIRVHGIQVGGTREADR
ncbi:MAG: sigma 54-interacting transcriptional regulator, partial [Gemmatimonadaceae bacterium]